ncbi:hypothetical protein F5B22DRAFT_654561 [Xylaria bambusicola]|uniref:uncharacterized protein n=1 Tax=Xylaria bambusicola TaxID=326684 RepID=UPI00200871A9|nr:uncharacterized protein F5B22DRAFT_654561 [Xylaria bambusicola]KAI0517789.1 hypothetical protein F5B22DRAFT_654561 [Xylaria bambusicola]
MVRLRWLASAIFLTAAIAADISSRQTVYEFVNPPAPGKAKDFLGNPIFVLGQTERLELTTPFHDFFITIFQESLTTDGANFGPTIFSVPDGEVKRFDWEVQLYDFDLAESNVFYLLLTSNVDDQPSISCHYFNITDPNPKEVPTSTSTSSSTVKTTSSALQATDSPTSSSTSSSDASPPAGLSTGAYIGIGIGVALAGLAGVFIAWVVYRRLRSQRGPQGQGQNEIPREYYKFSDLQHQDQYRTHSPASEIYTNPPRAELYSDHTGRSAAELPGHP